MDGRDALSPPPPSPSTRLRDHGVAHATRRPETPLLRHHQSWARRSRGAQEAVGDGGQGPRRRLGRPRSDAIRTGGCLMAGLEAEIARWRSRVGEVPAMNGRDLDELEGHLRDQIADLVELGLDEEEAFL